MGDPRQHQSRGVTLAEIVVAIGLLAISAVIVIGVFSKILSSGGKTAHQAVGRRLAERVLNRAVREGPPGWGTDATMQGSSRLQTQQTTSTEFVYRVSVSPAKTTSGPSALGDLLNVRVDVSWWVGADDGNGARRDQGQLSVSAEQLYYLEK